MLKGIFSFGLGFVKDYAIEKVMEELESTFNEKQKQEYETLESQILKSEIYLYSLIAFIVGTLVVSNIAFFSFDVGFFKIFFSNIVLGIFLTYQTIVQNAKAYKNRLTFYASLGDNVKQLSSDNAEKFKNFTNKIKNRGNN